jgi:hypothetical protein
VTAGSDLPGPAPLPSSDLAARTLPEVSVPVGSVFFRIHRSAHGPLYFGPRTVVHDRMRWDSPDDLYGVCYFAMHDHGAFAETMLRDLSLDDVSMSDLALRSLATIEVVESISLVQLHGHGLRAVGATAAVVHGSYDVTWAWSAALYSHPRSIDGVRYRARHDDSGFSVALFDRARKKIRLRDSTPLMAPSVAPVLARWLDRYGLGLVT